MSLIKGGFNMPNKELTRPISIVVVEDHELTRGGLVFAFKKSEQFRILGEAENGEEGVVSVGKLQPDVVLMDLGMPVMDGIEATKRIKQQHPDVKVVILTSHHDEEEVTACLAAGADAYCMKEIRTERLMQVMEMVMEGAVWLDPQIARTIMDSLTQTTGGVGIKSAHNGLHSADGDKNTRTRYNTELTEREMEVLQLIIDGKTNKEIAVVLSISVHTVKAHVTTIIQKLAVDDRTQAAVKALREGIV